VRAFHAEIVKDGAMPLDVLETKMNSWLEGGAATGPAAAGGIAPGVDGRPPSGAPD
jgi:hypothetical protein